MPRVGPAQRLGKQAPCARSLLLGCSRPRDQTFIHTTLVSTLGWTRGGEDIQTQSLPLGAHHLESSSLHSGSTAHLMCAIYSVIYSMNIY